MDLLGMKLPTNTKSQFNPLGSVGHHTSRNNFFQHNPICDKCIMYKCTNRICLYNAKYCRKWIGVRIH